MTIQAAKALVAPASLSRRERAVNAIIAEISAIVVFGEPQNYRPWLRIMSRVRKDRRRGSA